MKKTNIILLVIIAGVFATGFTSLFLVDLFSNASEYTHFNAARELDKKVHIAGEWVRRDEYSYDLQNEIFEFYLRDTIGTTELVKFYDPMPPNFESAERIVVIGTFEGESFVADKIIMKCPSKYNDTELEETAVYMRRKQLMATAE